MPQAAFAGAEPVEQVAALLEHNGAGLCVNVPLGTFAFGEEVAGHPALSVATARAIGEWGRTDFFDVAFTTADGAPAPFALPGGDDKGLVTVVLARPGHPDIGAEKDGRVCVRQGAFTNFLPRSITPVTLDDGRPGRVMVFDYDASWSEPMLQRHDDLTSERSIATLLSFNPGKGWGNLEDEFPAGRGGPFPPDMFARKGLAHVDLGAPHPQRIEIDGRGGVEVGHALLYRYPETLPDEVRRCAVQDAPGIAACLRNAAEGGAILGRLSLCEREDIGCMRDLLFAPPFATEPAACLAGYSADSDRASCAAFILSHGFGEDTAVEAPAGWWSLGFVRTRGPAGETEVHVRADATRSGAAGEPDETDRPWLGLACRDGALAPSLFWPGRPARWQGREGMTVAIAGKGEEEPSRHALEPDADGRVLIVAAADAAAFLRALLADRRDHKGEENGVEVSLTYHTFTLTVGDDAPLASEFTFRHPLTTREGETARLWDGMDLACGMTLRAAMGD